MLRCNVVGRVFHEFESSGPPTASSVRSRSASSLPGALGTMLVLAGGAQLRPARLQPLRCSQRSALPSLPARRHGVAPRARHVVARKRTLLVQVRAREPSLCSENSLVRREP